MLERSRESSDGKILPSEQEEMIRDVLGIAYGGKGNTLLLFRVRTAIVDLVISLQLQLIQ